MDEQPHKNEKMHQEGPVAYLDILGYKNILRRNEPDAVAKHILAKLKQLPSDSEKQYSISGEEEKKQYKDIEFGINNINKNIKSLIFSDTMLITTKYGSANDHMERSLVWGLFLARVQFVVEKMFKMGLPVRGVVTFGDHLIDDNTFAGRSIVSAHEQSGGINAAIVLIDKSASEEIKIITNDNPRAKSFLETLLLSYPVPFKDQKIYNHEVINYRHIADDLKKMKGDVRSYVYDKFSEFKKDVRPEVYEKLNNTEFFLRFCLKATTQA